MSTVVRDMKLNVDLCNSLLIPCFYSVELIVQCVMFDKQCTKQGIIFSL